MKNVFVILLMLITTLTYAQSNYVNYGALGFGAMSTNGVRWYADDYRNVNYLGSIYLGKDFSSAAIKDRINDETQIALVRYNVLEDFVEIKISDNENGIRVMPKTENLEYIFKDYSLVYETFKLSSGDLIEGYFIKYHNKYDTALISKPFLNASRVKTNLYGGDSYKILVNYNHFLLEDGFLHEINLKGKDLHKIISDFENKDIEYFKKNIKNSDKNSAIEQAYNEMSLVAKE